MERIVRIIAPKGRIDFWLKLAISLLLSGGVDILYSTFYTIDGLSVPLRSSFLEASFMAFPVSFIGLSVIGHLAAVQKDLYRQATVDTLSQLPNRRWFMEHTPSVMKDGQILMIIDIDHFKRINDRFGHDVGDVCLQQMAIHLRVSLGYQNNPSRIGGEEFAVLLSNTTEDEAAAFAKRISDGFTFDAGLGTALRINASVGIARCTSGQTRTQALRVADQAVYAAKANGRSCYVFSDGPRHPTYFDHATPRAA